MSTPPSGHFPPDRESSQSVVGFEDPDVGLVRLRVLDAESVLALWRAVEALDLEAAARVFDVERFGVGAEFAGAWTVEDMRAFLEVHAAVRAAVVDPVPPEFEEVPEGFPAGLVRLDGRWTDAALQRVDLEVLRLAGMTDGPVCDACREAGC